MNLIYKNEKPLFRIALGVSVLIWLLIVLGTLGLALLAALGLWLLTLVAHSAFISQVRGNGVKITREQYPDLHGRLLRACERVGVTTVPEMYLLRTDFFNALATKFLGRNFIVLFTDVVDALEDRPDALDFYIGHELGHIHRKHLVFAPVLAPAMVLPLLGAAYRRAEEYTCDLYGTACCQREGDVMAAMAAISAGDTRWKGLDAARYAEQIEDTRGFWMSLNELTGDYPWLTKRMARALASFRGESVSFPGRNGFAWIVAAFVPRAGAGGGIRGLLLAVILIGVLAAIAIPAYQDFMVRSQVGDALRQAAQLKIEVARYADNNSEWPDNLAALGYPGESLPLDPSLESINSIAVYEGGVIGIGVSPPRAAPGFLVLEPYVENGQLFWNCYGQDVDSTLLPPRCQ